MFWSLYARVYDSIEGLIPYRDMLDEAIAKADVGGASSVLDIGCGTGNLEKRLLRRHKNLNLLAVDAAGAMLDRARRKCGEKWFRNVDLNRPLQDQGVEGPFNVIFGTNVLYTLHNPERVIRELAKLAAPGAIMVQTTPKAGAALLPILGHHHREARIRPGRHSRVRLTLSLFLVGMFNLVILRRGEAGSYSFASEHELRKWYEGSGWKIRELSTTYAGQDWLVVAEKSV